MTMLCKTGSRSVYPFSFHTEAGFSWSPGQRPVAICFPSIIQPFLVSEHPILVFIPSFYNEHRSNPSEDPAHPLGAHHSSPSHLLQPFIHGTSHGNDGVETHRAIIVHLLGHHRRAGLEAVGSYRPGVPRSEKGESTGCLEPCRCFRRRVRKIKEVIRL